MNSLSRIVTGIVMIVIGVFLVLLGIMVSEGSFVSWFYGGIIFVLGVFIFLNNREDKIEQIKARPLKKLDQTKKITGRKEGKK